MTIRAIETTYAGYRFRNRLEASRNGAPRRFVGFVLSDADWAECFLCGRIQIAGVSFESTDGNSVVERGIYCSQCDARKPITPGWQVPEWASFYKGESVSNQFHSHFKTPRIMAGFKAARSARFEFGEKGAKR